MQSICDGRAQRSTSERGRMKGERAPDAREAHASCIEDRHGADRQRHRLGERRRRRVVRHVATQPTRTRSLGAHVRQQAHAEMGAYAHWLFAYAHTQYGMLSHESSFAATKYRSRACCKRHEMNCSTGSPHLLPRGTSTRSSEATSSGMGRTSVRRTTAAVAARRTTRAPEPARRRRTAGARRRIGSTPSKQHPS
jgi:hypothetical protein